MAETRVERRLAAIFASDIVGYSRLMGADEEGTLARLNAHRREFLEPKIAEHRGRIVKRTGDGVLIEFASAVDATRCAVEIQRGMTERCVDVTHGLVLLFGIGTKALPSWDSKTRWSDLLVGLAVRQTAGPSGHANSPHPSSREGHHSTAGWSSSFLLLRLILRGLHAAAAACSRVQRNSVPSTQMRCMITANRRARA